MPGMRMLAVLECQSCDKSYFGDLLAGHGLFYPMIIDRESGDVFDRWNVPWFSGWLRESYARRTREELGFTAEAMRDVRRPLLLNCLDALYGHSLLKLLNAQYYLDHRPELDLIVLVPRILRWMVPEGVAAVWTVDLPMRRGAEWNDWLADKLRLMLKDYPHCHLSIAFPHPHPNDFSIERFTQIQPFLLENWENALTKPCLTFIWREDRLVAHAPMPRSAARRLQDRLMGKRPLKPRSQQTAFVVELERQLRLIWPTLDFAVVGLGPSGGLPGSITDLRTTRMSEALERQWCERYARSQVVVGVHGSNMLLPSGHAAAVIELVPADRWGNIIQDILPRVMEPREGLFRYRFFPLETRADALASSIDGLFRHLSEMVVTMRPEFSDHHRAEHAPLWPIAYNGRLHSLVSADACRNDATEGTSPSHRDN